MEIAIIAHDGKKSEMVQFLMDFKALILSKKIKLIATGTTGKNAEKAGFDIKVIVQSSSLKSGDQAEDRMEEYLQEVLFCQNHLIFLLFSCR